MREVVSERTHWAILIGVGVTANSTVSSQADQTLPEDRGLRGADPDVVAIEGYLGTLSNPVDITILTTSGLPNGDSSSRKLPATYKNVISTLQRVIKCGRSGQFVYIHFSGHGTRRNVGRTASGALALVLLDKYLYGQVLRSALVEMVERGMLVTLVLDCCFSGNVLRTHEELRGADIRFVEYDPAMDEISEREDPFASATTDMRNANIKEDSLQLLKPDKYTVIAACGPHEVASEIEFAGGARRGALSYFLLDTLQTLGRCGAQLTHQSLHQHLCARFHAEYPHQTPMRYGSSSFSFFQGLTENSGTSFVPVFRDSTDGSLVLSAGQAHGVHKADEYLAYRYLTSANVDEVAGQDTESIKMVVQAVGCLTSELVTANPSDSARIERGSTWKAVCLNSYSLQKARIRLAPSLSDREELAEAAHGHPFLYLSTEERETEPCIFHITVNNQSAYEVQNAASKTIPNLPTLPLGAVGTRSTLMGMLGHLATFKYFEKIRNQTPDLPFESSFSLRCNRDPGPDGCYEVKDGDIWSTTFENRGGSAKYLAIFNFNPLWQVSNLVWTAGGGDYLVVLPRTHLDSGEVKIPMKMTVPAHIRDLGEGHRTAEDIVKVVVTDRPTAFPSMILPPLGDGVRGSPDQLARLLRGLFNASRTGVGMDGKWASQNFTIRTSM